jgi:hypothetical protein
VVGWLDDLGVMIAALTSLVIALRRYTDRQSARAPVPAVIETDGVEVR